MSLLPRVNSVPDPRRIESPLGTATVEQIVDEQGEIRSFRTLQKQPAQQGRTTHAQLHRFMSSRGGRKIQYASILVDALDLDLVPRPLDAVLTHV